MAKKLVRLPRRALTDYDLRGFAKQLKIPFFRGVFMRDSLPQGGPRKNESAIVNLDTSEGAGTHWVAYRKRGKDVFYFDPMGNLRPPQAISDYLGGTLRYNHDAFQTYNSYECGHLCLQFLL